MSSDIDFLIEKVVRNKFLLNKYYDYHTHLYYIYAKNTIKHNVTENLFNDIDNIDYYNYNNYVTNISININ